MPEKTAEAGSPSDPIEVVLAYHERTKHQFHRFAQSLGFLDWANQPNPFRRYAGAPLLGLPIRSDEVLPRYDDLFNAGGTAPRALDIRSLSLFLYHSLALSAWKALGGTSWALRVNPSSGNLHPTEAHLLLPPAPGIGEEAGVYHYAPREHALEGRASIDPARWQALSADLPPGAFFVGLSSIQWREAWKYGERAFRYCQHDAGHAIAACRIAAAALGWRLRIVEPLATEDLAALLGLDRDTDFGDAEREEPDLLALVVPGGAVLPARPPAPETIRAAAASATWSGRANALSVERIEWEAIDAVAAACRRPRGAEDLERAASSSFLVARPAARRDRSAAEIIRGRRSAVAMDGRTAIEKEAFCVLLERLLPSGVPWDLFPRAPHLHLGLFVHRVRGLDAGLYWLLRNRADEDAVRAALDPEFVWERPPGIPDHLPLYALARGDVRGIASTVSCGQEIAGDGAFSAAMVARFEPAIRLSGPHLYPRLFWEAGAIGQMLYLEAEAAGLRGTGIGCYFDDPVHEVFGIRGRDFQSLYHFTVGGAVEDSRLTTLPAYPVTGVR